MIILTDNSDTISTNTLVQEPQVEELPRFFKQLVYTSACFSVVPFALGLYNVSQSKLYSIPTIFGYVSTTPFHVLGLFLILQANRRIDMRLPFQTTSLKTIFHLSAEISIWLVSTIACAIGAQQSAPSHICERSGFPGGVDFPPWVPDRSGMNMNSSCIRNPVMQTRITLLVASVLSGIEAVILSTIVYLCLRHRRRQLAKFIAVSPPTTRQTSPKPISVA